MQAGRDVPWSVSGQGPARGSMVSVAVLETMVRIPGERLRDNCVEMLQHEGHAPLQISALFGSDRS
jgi:hypothetical protein